MLPEVVYSNKQYISTPLTNPPPPRNLCSPVSKSDHQQAPTSFLQYADSNFRFIHVLIQFCLEESNISNHY